MHSLVAIEPGSVNAIPIGVKRTEMVLRPDPSRVLLRPFTPGDLPRLQRIVNGIMAVSESDVGPLLDAVSSKFSARHQQISQLFKERFEQLREMLSIGQELSEQRQLLIGSYFVSEFAVESAALFNPSMVADPDQQGLPPGALRFVLSLRATGDGSISSIVFRTGIIHADHRIEVMAATACIVEPNQIPDVVYQKAGFVGRLLELGLANECTCRVVEKLRDSFTMRELESIIETELKRTRRRRERENARIARGEC